MLQWARVNFIADRTAAEKPFYTHCWAGYGRMGTLVAAYVVSTGETVEAAVLCSPKGPNLGIFSRHHWRYKIGATSRSRGAG